MEADLVTSNENNLDIIIWFQVFLTNILNHWTYLPGETQKGTASEWCADNGKERLSS